MKILLVLLTFMQFLLYWDCTSKSLRNKNLELSIYLKAQRIFKKIYFWKDALMIKNKKYKQKFNHLNYITFNKFLKVSNKKKEILFYKILKYLKKNTIEKLFKI